MNQKIDIIITWVDSNDVEWKTEKQKFKPIKSDSNKDVRFRDWRVLKYLFRGIDSFLPWVNRIHFVTWGHIPYWLNVEHPKINVVKHSDFIPLEFLPTFNSRVIELNFHRIKGLSEKFIYFNDDMFILNKMRATDFFRNNLPLDSFITDVTTPTDDTFNHTLFNNIKIINSYFNKIELLKKNFFGILNMRYGKFLLKNLLLLPWSKFTGFHNSHLPIPYLKSNFQKLWELEENILYNTCTHKFRNRNDVNHFLIRYYQLVTSQYIPSSIKGKYMEMGRNNSHIYRAIENKKYKMLCVNDSNQVINYEKERTKLKDSFDKILPLKSKFEK